MSVKITTLIENSAGEHHGLNSEHGLSFFIEKDDTKILFDTGQTGLFIKNAEQLRVDLRALDHVVLSHGHYDHSGGLKSLTKLTTGFNLIMGQGFFDEKYGFKNNSHEYLGNNFDENFLTEKGIAFQYTNSQCTELVPDVFVITSFPRVHEDEKINPRFKILKDGAFSEDSFADEVLLAIDTPKGLIVLLGCSHPGMKNMLDFTAEHLKRPLYAVLGGTHLVEANEESLAKSMDYLHNDDLKIIGVSHCTGDAATNQLSASNSRYFHNHTGSSLLVE